MAPHRACILCQLGGCGCIVMKQSTIELITYMVMSCHMGCLVWFASLECSMIVTDILALADVIIVMSLCHFQRCSIITTHRVFSSHK